MKKRWIKVRMESGKQKRCEGNGKAKKSDKK